MNSDYKDIDVVILAAGLGIRLRPLTDTIPKVMVPIAPGLPLLEHSVLLLKSQGFRRFILNLHYLPDIITAHFGDGSRFGVSIRYSTEQGEILETGGAIKKMESMIESKVFLLMYGDHLFFMDLRPLVDSHLAKKPLATITLKRSGNAQDGDLAQIDTATHKIIAWHARPHKHTTFGESLYLNTGFDMFSKKIFSYIPGGRPVKLDIEILPDLVAKKEEIYGYVTEEPILDMGNPEKYEAAKKYYQDKTSH